MKTVLPKRIYSGQKGIINGRFIGENTRLTDDVINECKQQKINGPIIVIDFKKAFDFYFMVIYTKNYTIFWIWK